MLADFALVEMDLCIGTVRVHEEIRSYLERKNSEVMASIHGMLVDRIEESFIMAARSSISSRRWPSRRAL
jgi:hypothetical protein